MEKSQKGTASLSSRGGLLLFGTLALAGLLAGAVLVFFTDWLNVHGPTLGSLSFSGNGALIVPFLLVPLYLVAGVLVAARWSADHKSDGLIAIGLLLYSVCIIVGGLATSRLWSAAGLA